MTKKEATIYRLSTRAPWQEGLWLLLAGSYPLWGMIPLLVLTICPLENFSGREITGLIVISIAYLAMLATVLYLRTKAVHFKLAANGPQNYSEPILQSVNIRTLADGSQILDIETAVGKNRRRKRSMPLERINANDLRELSTQLSQIQKDIAPSQTRLILLRMAPETGPGALPYTPDNLRRQLRSLPALAWPQLAKWWTGIGKIISFISIPPAHLHFARFCR